MYTEAVINRENFLMKLVSEKEFFEINVRECKKKVSVGFVVYKIVLYYFVLYKRSNLGSALMLKNFSLLFKWDAISFSNTSNKFICCVKIVLQFTKLIWKRVCIFM